MKGKLDIQSTCEYIREQIILHKIKPGERLTEQSICEELSIGRSTVRNALQQLSQSGLVEIVPNAGARVSVFTKEQLKSLCTIKNDLEVYAFNRTSEYFLDKDFEEMYAIVEEEKVAIRNRDFLQYLRAVEEFHNYIVDKVGNEYLSMVFHNLSNSYSVYQLLYDAFYEVRDDEFCTDYIHPKMIEAIRDRSSYKFQDLLDELSVKILAYYDSKAGPVHSDQPYVGILF